MLCPFCQKRSSLVPAPNQDPDPAQNQDPGPGLGPGPRPGPGPGLGLGLGPGPGPDPGLAHHAVSKQRMMVKLVQSPEKRRQGRN